MSYNLPLVRQSRRGQGGRNLEINIPQQKIHANIKGGLINEGGVMSSEYGKLTNNTMTVITMRYVRLIAMSNDSLKCRNAEQHGLKPSHSSIVIVSCQDTTQGLVTSG